MMTGNLRMRWGLVPSWWPKPLKELKAATFNARAETVADKPFFRDGFRRTRCTGSRLRHPPAFQPCRTSRSISGPRFLYSSLLASGSSTVDLSTVALGSPERRTAESCADQE
jgi:hypothetical protein